MTLKGLRRAYDSDELARALARTFSNFAPVGFIVGRTMLRDEVVQLLECSAFEADEIVDTLILRGKLVFLKPPGHMGAWAFRVPLPGNMGEC